MIGPRQVIHGVGVGRKEAVDQCLWNVQFLEVRGVARLCFFILPFCLVWTKLPKLTSFPIRAVDTDISALPNCAARPNKKACTCTIAPGRPRNQPGIDVSTFRLIKAACRSVRYDFFVVYDFCEFEGGDGTRLQCSDLIPNCHSSVDATTAAIYIDLVNEVSGVDVGQNKGAEFLIVSALNRAPHIYIRELLLLICMDIHVERTTISRCAHRDQSGDKQTEHIESPSNPQSESIYP